MSSVSSEDEKLTPCPRCGTHMALTRVIPAFAGHPELRSYMCRPCSEAVTAESSLAWRLRARRHAA
jgi:hypothetical protein